VSVDIGDVIRSLTDIEFPHPGIVETETVDGELRPDCMADELASKLASGEEQSGASSGTEPSADTEMVDVEGLLAAVD